MRRLRLEVMLDERAGSSPLGISRARALIDASSPQP